MIRFKGNLSGTCQKYIRRKEGIVQSIIFTIVFIILAFPLYLMITPVITSEVFWAMYLIIYLCFMLLSFLLPLKKDFLKSIPHEIIISMEDDIIVSVSANNTLEMTVSSVETVFDMGLWYVLKFSPGPNYPPRFICQKDLIVEGTIEDFEKLFEEKIIKQ